jgi:Porin PorA
MRMNKRAVGAALFAGGAFALVVAGALSFVITPLITRMPYDVQPPETTVEAVDATFVQARQLNGATVVAVQRADVLTTTGIRSDVNAAAQMTGTLKDRAVIWNVFNETTRADTDELISADQSRIALDRYTGTALDWSGQCYTDTEGKPCLPGSVSYSGQVYSFPFGTEKKTYQYYDLSLGKALPINYRGTDEVEGLTAYRFEQVIPEQPITMPAESVNGLLGIFSPGSASGTVLYRGSRTVWVEPVTGSIVDIRDDSRRLLISDTGVQTVLFQAVFRYTPDTRRTIAEVTADGYLAISMLGTYVPIGLAALGVGLMIWGYRLTLRSVAEADPDDSAAHRAGHWSEEPDFATTPP